LFCRECGRELPEAGVGRPRSYCSVTCRQRAYRRRKAEAWSGKGGQAGESPPDASGERGRSATAEAIMIRVHLTEAPPGEPAEGAPAPAPDPDWKTLDELARTALRLARRLREQQDAGEREVVETEAELRTTAVTTSDLAGTEQGPPGPQSPPGPSSEVPTARDSPDR
jgi:hypothetical protein